MAQEITTRRENTGFLILSYVILVASGLVGTTLNPPASDLHGRVAIILLVVIALVQLRMPQDESPAWKYHLYLVVHGGLVAGLLFLQPGWTMYPMLFAPLIVWLVLALTINPGGYWIALFTLVTAASFVVGSNPQEGLMALIIYGAAFSFFGAFANALVRATEARRHSQQLLAELQEAHHQLQEHTAKAEEMAIIEERNRLAREMHDTLGHRLTVAAVQLEGAQRLMPVEPDRAVGMIETVRTQVREALGELRGTVAALRIPLEADLRLRRSLQRLADSFESATGLTIHRIFPEQMPALPGTHRLALYRAAQESLTNIQKHAQASQVWLTLMVQDEQIALLISDDGRGLTLKGSGSGFGLRGIRERAVRLGGEMVLENRPGGGAQLHLTLPLSKGDEEEE